MASVSFFELLVLFAFISTLLIVLALLRRVSRIEVWISKRIEARFSVDATRNEKPLGRVGLGIWWLPLPLALIPVGAEVVLIAVVVLYAQLLGPLPASLLSAMDKIVSGVAVVLLILGLLVHFTGGRRYVKYELLVSGVSLLSIPFFVLVAKAFTLVIRSNTGWWMAAAPPGIEPVVGAWTVVAYVSFFVAARILAALLVRPAKHGERSIPSTAMRRAYRWIRKTGFAFALLSISGLTQPLLALYLIFRYLLGNRMAQTTIIYLRSFHYVEGPAGFGKIVSRVASRYGALLALTHEAQRQLQLHGQTRLTDRAQLTQVSDAIWKDWIVRWMQTASLIIIDRSVSSEGLTWELEQALTHVDPARIVLLTKKGAIAQSPTNLWNLEYELGRQGERQARKALDEHLSALFLNGDRNGSLAVVGT